MGSPLFYPDLQALKTSDDRPLEAYYAKRASRSLGSARAYNHTGAKGDSGVLTLSFSTKSDVFKISLKQGDNNVYSNDEMFMSEMQNVIANFAEGLEAASSVFLFSNRSGINPAAVEGKMNHTRDTYEILDAVETRAVQITKIVMDINKYGGAYEVYCDSISYNKFQYQAAQGAQNATNLSFQFGGVTFIHSVGLTAQAASLSYTKGYWLAVPVGSVGLLPWIPKQNRQGVSTSVNRYGSIVNPVDGMLYAIHEYESRADDQGNNGQRQDVVKEVEVSIDLAFEVAPLSAADETPIMAFAIVGSYTS